MLCERLFQHRTAVLSVAAAALVAVLGAADPAAAKSKEQGEKAAKKDPYAVTTREAGPPVLALVSLKDQRITVYDADGPILSAPVSSGQTDYETPVGIYSILQKNAEHYSNIYESASMPHMQRITWSGVALHGGPLPGYAASHGCVRLPYKFAERLFGLTHLGTRVIVSRNNVAPVPVSHPLLFKRTPYRSQAGLVTKATALVGNMIGGNEPPQSSNEPADVAERAAALNTVAAAKSAEAETIEKEAEPARALAKEREPEMKKAAKALKAAEKTVKQATDSVAYADKILARAKSDKSKQRAEDRKAKADAKLAEAQAKYEAVKAEMQPKIDSYQQAADALKALEDERDAAKAVADEAKRKLSPVQVFVSLKTQKLYVRQGFQPLFETPVTIANPYTPIGTHTFTAVDYGENGRDMRWTVVSIAGRQPGEYDDDYYGEREWDDDDYYYRPRRRVAKSTSSKPVPTDVAAAKAALDRITIPEEARERISELVLPGTSLIVSDEEASKETGQQTGFVVLISGEPQGAIKKRPKRDPYADDYYDDNDYYDRRGRRDRRGPFGGPFFRW
jgi:L,D-transpeptidase catalytic domain